MPTVKVLAIEYDGPNLDTLIGLLKCFPCLERLYVIFNARSRMKIESVQKYGPLDPIECLESYLKRVVLEGYSGDMPNVEFAKFFVLNAKVLEEMKFGSIHSRDREWKSNQHMWLQVDSRASRGARFEFTSRYCRHNGLGNSHTHDLPMANPFKCFDAACRVGAECLFYKHQRKWCASFCNRRKRRGGQKPEKMKCREEREHNHISNCLCFL